MIGYLDDNPLANSTSVIGPVNHLPYLLDKYKSLFYTIGINSSSIRRSIDREFGLQERAANLVHETAVIGSHCSYKNGLTMGPYSVLTTMVSLGGHVHINTAASINQASSIGDYCTVSPGARVCGDVSVGEGTSIGAGAIIINFKTVGSDCILGAGTVVIDNISDGSTVVGVPGREIKRFGEYI